MLHYEGEFALEIGCRCRQVPRERALEAVSGCFICNDVSLREWQMATPTQPMGKSFCTHSPIDQWLTTPDELSGP
jgi:2-keto-4-pentenoate hydratase/2-oxohepta-3-ene-1,7-dioic acid hydratase in catechol pathway